MFVEKYFYVTGDTGTKSTVNISDIDRSKFMTAEFMKKFPELLDIDNTGSTAFLYAGGPASHHSDIRNIKDLAPHSSIVMKGQVGFTAYNVARRFSNIDYVSINANACASSMYCLHEARWLLDEYDDVIIYAEDLTDDTQALLFSQLGIDLVCGDGAAVMHLTASKTINSIAEITDTAWAWNKDSSPMGVSTAGYLKVLNKLEFDSIDLVKAHGSGTLRNDEAEDTAIEALLPNSKVIRYKQVIGHTQGASALIELCMLLDREDDFTAVCLASGLGAHYGACTVNKG